MLALIGLATVLAGTSGGGLLFVATPLLYLSFNSHQILGNMEDFFQVPSKYMELDGKIKENALSAQLAKDTILFDWAVKLAVGQIAKELNR